MGGFVLQLLAGEGELGVFEEEFFPVQEGSEDVRWERGEREERVQRLERLERKRHEIRRPNAEGGRSGLRGRGGDLGARRVLGGRWD